MQHRYDDLTDEQLVELHLSGDPRGMEVLYDRFFDRIYRLAYAKLRNDSDAQDAVSAVFLKLVRSIDSFRGESKFSTWIYTVANNAIMDMIRRRRTTLSIDADIETDDGDSIAREFEDNSPGGQQAVDEDFASSSTPSWMSCPRAEGHYRAEVLHGIELSGYCRPPRIGWAMKSRINRAVAALRAVNRTVSAGAR